jgi:hypothetical protein
MLKLKLNPIRDDKPTRATIELPAALHRDLQLYAELLAQEGGSAGDPIKLIVPMLQRFIATDRAFAAARKRKYSGSTETDQRRG